MYVPDPPEPNYSADLPEPDLDALREQWWETYLDYCKDTDTKPSVKDFDVWIQDMDLVYD